MAAVIPPKCAQCGLVNPMSESSCRRCGARLDATSRASPPAEERTGGWRTKAAGVAGAAVAVTSYQLWDISNAPVLTPGLQMLKAIELVILIVSALAMYWLLGGAERRSARYYGLLAAVIAVAGIGGFVRGALRSTRTHDSADSPEPPATEPLLVSYRAESPCPFSVAIDGQVRQPPLGQHRGLWTDHVRMPVGAHTTLVVTPRSCPSSQPLQVSCAIEVVGAQVRTDRNATAPASARCEVTVARR